MQHAPKLFLPPTNSIGRDVSGKIECLLPAALDLRVIGDSAPSEPLRGIEEVRMCSPNVLKAVYRRDDCLGCSAADYWAAYTAARVDVKHGLPCGVVEGC